jgi:hypothetical protein
MTAQRAFDWQQQHWHGAWAVNHTQSRDVCVPVTIAHLSGGGDTLHRLTSIQATTPPPALEGANGPCSISQ